MNKRELLKRLLQGDIEVRRQLQSKRRQRYYDSLTDEELEQEFAKLKRKREKELGKKL